MIELNRKDKKRIREVAAGKSKKRITPDDKKGALPKKVLQEKQYFSEFMEYLSKQRKQENRRFTPHKGVSHIGDVIGKMPNRK